MWVEMMLVVFVRVGCEWASEQISVTRVRMNGCEEVDGKWPKLKCLRSLQLLGFRDAREGDQRGA